MFKLNNRSLKYKMEHSTYSLCKSWQSVVGASDWLKICFFLKVWKVAVGGSSLIMALMIVFGILWGLCFGILPRQSAFVAACLSLSSTPLVAKFVESKDDDHYAKGNSKTILFVS